MKGLPTGGSNKESIPSQSKLPKQRIQKLLEIVEPFVPNLGRRRNAQDENPDPPQPSSGAERRMCGVCSYKMRRMTKQQCPHCKNALCGEHQVILCQQCDDPVDNNIE